MKQRIDRCVLHQRWGMRMDWTVWELSLMAVVWNEAWRTCWLWLGWS